MNRTTHVASFLFRTLFLLTFVWAPVVGRAATPTISSLTPTSGAIGASVTITGTNLGATQGTSTVKFNGTAATITSWSATSIVTKVPTGATTGKVVVTVSGVSSSGTTFTVLATPTISSLTPTSGAIGASVTIAGTNFGATQGTSTVKFNGTTATITSWSATSIVTKVPTGVTTGTVVVTASGVSITGPTFTVLATPTISSLTPTSGAIGASVTIAGTNFGATKGTVQFNGTAATSITTWTATSIVTVVPTGATTGAVSASASGVTVTGPTFVVGAPGVAVTTDVLPQAAVGIDYDTALEAGTGQSPFTWSVISGSLPTGLSLVSSTGEISGTPTAVGSGSFTVQVIDNNGNVATKTLPIVVGSSVSGRAVSSSACSNSNTSVSSLSCGVGNTDGNVVACAISIAGNVQVSSVTDNANPANAYSNAALFYWSSGPRLEIWISDFNSGPATAVTANLASGTQFSMSCDTLVGIDGWGNAANANYGQSTNPSVSVTTVGNTDWVLAGLVAKGAGLVTKMDVSTTTTGPTATDVGSGIATVYQAVAGSTTLNATLSTSETWALYGLELSVPPPPEISSITPTSGSPGTILTVTGSNFLDAGSLGDITMNGVVVVPTSWTDSTITLTVPIGATSGPVSVGVGGNVSNAINFTVPVYTTSQAPTPTFSPTAGTYSGSQTVTISDTDTAATIYFTVNNPGNVGTPTTASPVYTGTAITVYSNETLQAIAVDPSYAPSNVGTAVYNIREAPPTFSPPAGSYVGPQNVTITNPMDPSATIYYTTDGSTPTTASTQFIGPITVSSAETIKAIDSDSGWANSLVASAAYTFTTAPATPIFSPAAGAYTGAQFVTISDTSLDATIYYTVTSGTSGTTPTTSSSVYTGGALTVSSTETLGAIAAVAGYTSSPAATATYTLPAVANSTTALAVTSGENPVTSVAAGSAVTLTATVASSSTAVTPGTVNFCDATATYCTDIHLLGTAQLTSAGTASINLRPGLGSHSYKAIFVGTSSYATSTSSTVQFTVTGSYPTTTTIVGTGGSAGNYTLAAQVMGTGSNTIAPTGTVSILDTNSANAVLGTGPLSAGSATISFANVSNPKSGVNSAFIVTGDFNGDSKLDLAVANSGDNTITILLGNGDGTFTQANGSPIVVGQYPQCLAVGDFNDDGKLDLAVANFRDNTITILFGNGDGTFTQANGSPIAVGSGPWSVAVSDFNEDGKLDLAITNEIEGTVTILLGNGDGTFTQANGSPITVGSEPLSIAGRDLNGDGKIDLAVANSGDNTITILLGNGDGTFTQANGSPITVGSEPWSVAVGDFNKDGKQDLAVTNRSGSTLTILLGSGNGTFTAASGSPIAMGYDFFPSSVAVADFNLDGIPDLAISEEFGNTATILLGNGDGTFSTLANEPGRYGYYPLSIAVGDFNGDGVPDLAMANDDVDNVTVLQTNLQEIVTTTVTGIAPVGTGTHNVGASYGGDSSFAGSTSATTPLTTVVDVISTVSPISGPAGTLVTITGIGFGASQGANTVTVGGITAVASAWTNTQIQAYIPNSTGPGPQSVVVTIGGVPGVGLTYTVTPWIASITPSTGFPNSAVTIVGTNFGSNGSGSSAVTFNGISVKVTSWTSSTISLILPSGVTTGPVVVTASTWNGSPFVSNAVMFTVQSSPTITGLSPVSGPVGTSVTITGGNFGTSGTVTFNGVSATPTTWGIDTIIVPVPVGATTGPIVVTAGGIASNSYIYTVSGGITSVSPLQGNIGTTVTINGTGFGTAQGNSSVTFNGVPATPTSWSNSSIVVTVPSGATTGNVGALVNGVSTVGPLFTILPFINSLSPSAGPVGTLVTVSGSNFGSAQGISSVAFGQVAAVPTQWSQNMIVATVPQGAITGPVVVSVAGQASNGVPFAVGSTTTAAITGTVTQSDGVTPIAGASVTVSQGNNTVATTATNASGIYSVSNLGVATYSLQVSAPGFGVGSQSGVSASAGQATVVNFSLSGQSIITYTYDPVGRLVGLANSTTGAVGYSYDAVGNILSIGNVAAGQVSILGFTPTSGPVGAAVTISGTSFSGNAQQDTVTIGGSTATVTSATSSQITITVPTGATTGPITVTTPSGTATSSAPFSIQASASALSITSFTPSMSNVGATVTISGSGFDLLANDRVEFDGALTSLTSATSTSISATVPANAQSGPISIATPLGNAVSSTDFFVLPSAYTPSQVDFTGQMSMGGEFTGTINNGGDIGIVAFNATAGQQFNLLVNGSTIPSANISIVSPSGSILENTAIGIGGAILDSISAPTTGAYTILVASNGAAYTGSLTLNLSQNSPQLSSPGSTTTGQIVVNTPGGSATVLFNGTAGQLASVLLTNMTIPGTCWSAVIRILNPNGSTLSSANMCGGSSFFLSAVALPTTGTYTLVITPLNGNTGSATVAISIFNEQAMPVTPLTSGTTGTLVTINIPGQSAQLAFSGTAGQTASVQLSNSTFPGGCYSVWVGIFNPDGSQLSATQFCFQGSFSMNPVTLPTTGTYTLVIYPENGGTGSTSVALSLFNEQTNAITPGTPTAVIINTPGQSAQLTFNGTAGQLASVQLLNSTFPGGCWSVYVSILNPDGSTLTSNKFCFQGSFFLNAITLPTTGTYTVIIYPLNGGTGSANVTLSVFYEQTGTIVSGTPVMVIINTPGQNSQLSFSGTAGQSASVHLSNSTFPGCYSIWAAILNPGGSQLSTTQFCGQGSFSMNPVTLPTTGTYTLVIGPENGGTGSASVSLTLQ